MKFFEHRKAFLEAGTLAASVGYAASIETSDKADAAYESAVGYIAKQSDGRGGVHGMIGGAEYAQKQVSISTAHASQHTVRAFLRPCLIGPRLLTLTFNEQGDPGGGEGGGGGARGETGGAAQGWGLLQPAARASLPPEDHRGARRATRPPAPA